MSLIATAIRRPVTVSMFTIAALVFGLVLVGKLGFNLLPELSYPTLTVRTDFPGSAPAEVENLITRPLEGVLGTIKGLRQVRSVSKAGRSDIYLEFYWGTDVDIASLDVREKMDQVPLPLEVKPPSLLRFNPNNEPIIRMSLSQKLDDGVDKELALTKLRRFADLKLTRRLVTIEGVAAAKASGGLEDEIQIQLKQEYLSKLKLTVADISQKLKSQNINLSGGQIRSGQRQLLVRTFNEYRTLEDFENTIIFNKDQKLIRLKDIADVNFSHKDPTAITRHNGEQAVEIAIYKEGDSNTVKVAEAVRLQIEALKKELPENMSLSVQTDASKFINQAISELISSAIWGGLLAMIIIYLFLGKFLPTLIISATIPLSVVITFNLMYSAEVDMNIMSLGGLALAVGMLVDNAIVVLENIAKKQEQGLSLAEAALEGSQEVSGAITASTLTTIAVFLPLIFVEGIAGQLFKDQALTITFSLIVSLGVALTLIPMLAARKVKKNQTDALNRTTRTKVGRGFLFLPELFLVIIPATIIGIIKFIIFIITKILSFFFVPARNVFEKAYQLLCGGYHSLLASALNQRALTILLSAGLLAISLFAVKDIPQVVLPEMAQGVLKIKVEYAPGTAIQLSDLKVIALSEKLLAVDGINQVYSTAGSGNKLTANPEQEGENMAEFTLLLDKGISRDREDSLLKQLRILLEEESSGIESDVERPQLFSFSTPISVEIYGYDMDILKRESNRILETLAKSDNFVDLHSNMQKGYPEVQISFDHEKLAYLNISIQQANNSIVNSIRGNKATRYRLKEQQIEVLVRLEEASRDELKDIGDLIINPTSDHPIPLSAVAELKLTQGPSEVMRIDQQRVVLVEGQIKSGSLSEAITEVNYLLKDVRLPYGINMQVGGQSEEMDRSFNSLLMALALAIFLVYLVMASQFESLLHPFIILFSIPLAVVGAVFALIVTNTELSVVVFLGLIMLAGIVVNNAIVLIDRINQLREEGQSKIDAIKSAAESRLRPIMMTTLTTTLGMLPLALGISEGTEIRAPMAITVIGGLLASTLLTLIVIPVMYSLFDIKDFEKNPHLNVKNMKVES
ncbi:MAG: acriflavin resistance protein [Kangiella sp.]|nr:MAG: acriflavin resistance protein [Kangiella sp.]